MTQELFYFSTPELILSASLLLVFFVQVFYYRYFYRAVFRRAKRVEKGIIQPGTEQPPVTILICARDQAQNLEKNLPLILEQTYPEFQVVVVNDASSDDTENVLTRFQQTYSNLYQTFVPSGIENVSAKKMAVSIGIKAARYDLILLTDANCSPVSRDWISTMMRSFKPGCDLVLGYSSYGKKKGLSNLLVAYDTLFTALQFMGYAQAGKTYMGYGNNMAYRKELFFRNRGFASHLNLKSGEDDLFVREIATKTNTSIEASAAGKIQIETTDVWYHWKDQKLNRLATSSFYSFGTKFRTATEMCSRWLFYGLFLALLLVGIWQNHLVFILLPALLFVLRYILQLSTINAGAKVLDERRFYTSIPIFDLLLPVLNLLFRLNRIFRKDNTHTWRVLK